MRRDKTGKSWVEVREKKVDIKENELAQFKIDLLVVDLLDMAILLNYANGTRLLLISLTHARVRNALKYHLTLVANKTETNPKSGPYLILESS